VLDALELIPDNLNSFVETSKRSKRSWYFQRNLDVLQLASGTLSSFDESIPPWTAGVNPAPPS